MSNIIIAGQQFNNINKITFDTPDGNIATFLVEGYEPPIPDVPVFSRIFSENSPEVISYYSNEISKNGYTSSQVAEIYGWNLGDIIPITLTSDEVIEMQIIGINHDVLSSDHTSKAGITLQMKECLSTLYKMDNSGTNAGGYPASEMKSSILPMLKASLPQAWQDIIKLVDKKSANGGSTNYTETLTLSEDLFLFAEIEIFGTAKYAQNGETEGSLYEYWNGKDATDRIKKYGASETATNWWLRSSYVYSTSYMCYVNNSGGLNAVDTNYSRGVSFGFCV